MTNILAFSPGSSVILFVYSDGTKGSLDIITFVSVYRYCTNCRTNSYFSPKLNQLHCLKLLCKKNLIIFNHTVIGLMLPVGEEKCFLLYPCILLLQNTFDLWFDYSLRPFFAWLYPLVKMFTILFNFIFGKS